MIGRRTYIHFYLLIKKKVRAIIHKRINNEVLTFSFFILLASLFWSLQVMRDEVSFTYHIPIYVVDQPENIIITSDLPVIEVKLKDKGAQLLNLWKRSMTIDVPFNPKYKEQSRLLLTTEELNNFIQRKLPTTTQIVSISPNFVSLYYSVGSSKQIPVEVIARLSIAKQQILAGKIVSTPSFVTAYAPTHILDRIHTAYTDTIDTGLLSETTHFSVGIQGVEGVRFVPEVIDVTIPIETFTEKELTLPIECVGLPSNKAVRTFPSKVNISCFVALSRYKSATSDKFRAVISYEDIIRSNNGKAKVDLIKSPDFVTNSYLAIDSVEVILEELFIHD
ncbi:MAG: hypothetical protein ACRCTF_09495 [Bacteroidales bacterium]